MEGVRKASHAGSWYSNSRASLNSELDSYLESATAIYSNVRLIIAPHAGYSYSGATAAWAYKHINPSEFSRVFLLGPSHHAYIKGCYLPCSSVYSTPIGDIPVDLPIISQLQSTNQFGILKKREEEKEHSLEMHLPYIRKIFGDKNITLVPVMVGDLKLNNAFEYGSIFSQYLKDSQNLFIISSDFCHWGDNFDYQPYDRSKGEVFEYIEHLDRTGMNLIEAHNLPEFFTYLSNTGNTICGCNPISIGISTILHSQLPFNTSFVKYAQSNQVRSQDDFSVSYASSVTYLN
jgi:MEMO1 family protein